MSKLVMARDAAAPSKDYGAFNWGFAFNDWASHPALGSLMAAKGILAVSR